MLFFSKSLASMAFEVGLFSKFAVNAVASSTLPYPLPSCRRLDEIFPWFWREQKGLYVKYKSYGARSSSSSGFPVIASNCLPSSGSSKPLSSNFPLHLVPSKHSSLSRKIKATYIKGVPPRRKSTSGIDTSKVQRTFNYRHTLLQLPSVRARMLPSRDLHSSCILLGKSKSDLGKDCKSTKEICKSKEDVCSDTESCKEKDAECYPERVKCELKKTVREDTADEKQVCPKSCVRGGKCIIAASKKPTKMVYGSTECPPPKLISPRTCPRTSSNEYANDEPVCTDKVAARKLRKEVCVPPPLPGPPTDPVPLCPCPPPPKLHPGPCPCPAYKEDLKIKPSPPCPVKDKYPCCFPIYYCPPKKPCARKLPCDQTKKTKS